MGQPVTPVKPPQRPAQEHQRSRAAQEWERKHGPTPSNGFFTALEREMQYRGDPK